MAATFDHLAAARFAKTGSVASAKPAEALNACLADVQDIRSVYVIAVDSAGESSHYSAGPDFDELRDVWTRLQWELARVAHALGREG